MKNLTPKNTSWLLVLMMLVFSCQKNEVELQQKNEFSQIGLMHNQGLDYVFNYIKKNKGAAILDKDNYISLAEVATKEFINTTFIELTQAELEIINSNIESVNKSLKKYTEARIANGTELYQSVISEVENSLTQNQTSYLNELFNIIINESGNIVTLQQNLISLENRAFSLPTEDKQVILLAIAIARESCNYWNENFKLWQNELGGSTGNAKTNSDFSWGIVAAGDVAAGVAVGIVTSTALVVPFVGWGFWAAVTGGAAVIGSGVAAIAQL